MSNPLDYIHNVSLRLSQILNEIGINEKIVMKSRRSGLLEESLFTIRQQMLNNTYSNLYTFGSQTEGTTTLGLQSDMDCLVSFGRINVIQDWSEWEPGKRNMLMIQDETVSPGYCLLQYTRNDAPLPENDEVYHNSNRDRIGRILMKSTLPPFYHNSVPAVRHGPAHTLHEVPGTRDTDLVTALPCKSWPMQADKWLDQLSESQWPTRDMREYCMYSGCFVVPVGKIGSRCEDFEWRISTSLAERCLMFNLNITQVRCYVLMKMIIKTFITPQFPDSISSFICKTVLLHCISNTRVHVWKENTLLACLTFCLSTLYNCVLNEYCPHFMISENNLMAGRISPEAKHTILENISYVVRSNGTALLEINCDLLGSRIQYTFISNLDIIIFPDGLSASIAGCLLTNTLTAIRIAYSNLLDMANDIQDKHILFPLFKKYLSKLFHIYIVNQGHDKLPSAILARYLSITLGSVLASFDVYNQGTVGKESLTWMYFGLNCDVAYGKLKLASVFYCTGDMDRTELILKNIEESYDLNVVEPICACYSFQQSQRKRAFDKLCYEEKDEYTLLNRIGASCVLFLRYEMNCCPHELQHEMFRSTQEDHQFRSLEHIWMDMAVIDSLTYLYFLQYKVYTRLGRHEDKQRALSNLARCILQEPNFGHKETALNLLGQIMEQENKIDAAFKCYLLSLKTLDRNNAAKFLICRLICSLVGNQMQLG